jgi:hypothetical protein
MIGTGLLCYHETPSHWQNETICIVRQQPGPKPIKNGKYMKEIPKNKDMVILSNMIKELKQLLVKNNNIHFD